MVCCVPANTWTPSALASEARPWRGCGWRAVEALHRVTTMGLAAGRLDDQTLLEDILEQAKPRLPTATAGLHWLLATPFRYWPPPDGSRFRRRHDPGVFYGAEERQTACAEAGYWRLRFWLDSAGLASRSSTVELSLFQFQAATEFAIDLSLPPLSLDSADWAHPGDYRATQALADQARQAAIELIRYPSVRRQGGACLALLTPAVFHAVAEPFQQQVQTWSLHLQPPDTAVWQRHLHRESWVFRFARST